MPQFSPCRGGEFCSQGGTHCQGCGRSHEEIAQTRQLVDDIAQYAMQMGYDNLDDFTTYVATKAAGKVRWLQTQDQGGIPIGGQ